MILKFEKTNKFLLFTVGLTIFLFIFYFIGIEKIIYQLLKLNLFYYGLAVFSIFLTIVFWMFRWKTFIKSCGYKVSNLTLLINLMIGLAVNNLTPLAKFGGEPIRAYILKKDSNIPIRDGLATVTSELTIELFTSSLMVILAFFLIEIYIKPPLWIFSVLIFFIIVSVFIFGIVFGIYSNKKFISRIIIWVINKIKKLRALKKDILKRYQDFQKTFRKGFQNKKLFSEAIFYGIMMKIFDILKFFFIFMAMGYTMGILEIIIIVGMATMLISIPSTPGSLGIFEGGLVSVFVLLGIPLEIGATAVFLERIVWFWGITIIGGLLGFHYGINKRILGNLKINKIS